MQGIRDAARKHRKYVDLDPDLSIRSVAFAYIEVLSHLSLDYLTARGVLFLFPLDATRRSAEIFFYTETTITLASLLIIARLARYTRTDNSNRNLPVAIMATLITVGAIRVVGKGLAEESFNGSDVLSYPEPSLSKWILVSKEGQELSVSKYDIISRRTLYRTTFQTINVLSGSKSEGLREALQASDKLSLVKKRKRKKEKIWSGIMLRADLNSPVDWPGPHRSCNYEIEGCESHKYIDNAR